MDLITRNCPRCNAPLEVETGLRNLECRYCGCALEVVKQGADREYHLHESLERNPSNREVVPCPESLTIEEFGDTLTISWRWFSPFLIFLAFFCVAWNAFLLFWYGMAITVGAMAPWPLQLLLLVFPIAHVAVGVGLTYFTLAGFLNKTSVIVDDDSLRVEHGPIPWKQPPPVAVEDIDEIYVTRSHTMKDMGHSYQKMVGHVVNVLKRDGVKVELLKRMTDSDKADCIVDRLRRHIAADY